VSAGEWTFDRDVRSMRRFLAGVMVAGFVVVLIVPALAKTETVTGQLVDQNSYMKDKVNNKGVDIAA
jgi:hypothetical protein